MGQFDMFWVEQLIAYCIAGVMIYIVDKINSKKQIKDIEE